MIIINTKKKALGRLLGRSIVDVNFQRTQATSGALVAEPVITLQDGSLLQFVVRELEDGYAVEMLYVGLDERDGYVR